MMNWNWLQVHKQDTSVSVLDAQGTDNIFDNVRFVLNAANQKMQIMARCIGFKDFKEMAVAYYMLSELSFQDVEGDLELFCNLFYADYTDGNGITYTRPD